MVISLLRLGLQTNPRLARQASGFLHQPRNHLTIHPVRKLLRRHPISTPPPGWQEVAKALSLGRVSQCHAREEADLRETPRLRIGPGQRGGVRSKGWRAAFARPQYSSAFCLKSSTSSGVTTDGDSATLDTTILLTSIEALISALETQSLCHRQGVAPLTI